MNFDPNLQGIQMTSQAASDTSKAKMLIYFFNFMMNSYIINQNTFNIILVFVVNAVY